MSALYNHAIRWEFTDKNPIAGPVKGSGVRVSSLYADSIYEKNDEMEPEHIHPRDSFFEVSSPELKYTLRHESLTMIVLKRK